MSGGTAAVRTAGVLLVSWAVAGAPLGSRAAEIPGSGASESARTESALVSKTQAAMTRGLDWLKASQKANGAWSNENYPALTAFGLWVFAQSDHPAKTDVCARAAAFVKGFVQPDGGIYKPALIGWIGGGLSTYNTAICMTALHACDPSKYAPEILRAREFVAGSQLQGDSSGAGGFGYNRAAQGRAGRADLSNTAWALMAMRATQGLEDLRRAGKKHADVDWKSAAAFAGKLQNQDSKDAENYGGFGYEGGGGRGKTFVTREGTVALRGYGSMTYAGLESMIFAEVTRDDPRVVSACRWAARHWSVDENPGMGSRGLFYYYTVMAKALSLMGSDVIPRSEGDPIPWKRQLLEKLVSLQRPDGSWSNADNTFWEGDPNLATAYSLLAMQYALRISAK